MQHFSFLQAEIYKMDFLAEREAREKLNQKKEELQEDLNKALVEIERFKQERTSRYQNSYLMNRLLLNICVAIISSVFTFRLALSFFYLIQQIPV